jgi:acetylornithine deacetylase/succinyl-diaminopimelate desuccinylase-like protein
MPRPENAAVIAAEIVTRLSVPGPIRMTPVTTRMLETAADALPPATGSVLRAIAAAELDSETADREIDRLCDPVWSRAIRALIRDTFSPNIIEAGVKYNVIPGDATVDVDCRLLPGSTDADILNELERRIGPDLLPSCRFERLALGEPVEAPPRPAVGHARRRPRRPRSGGRAAPRHGAVRDGRQGQRDGRNADVRVRPIRAGAR